MRILLVLLPRGKHARFRVRVGRGYGVKGCRCRFRWDGWMDGGAGGGAGGRAGLRRGAPIQRRVGGQGFDGQGQGRGEGDGHRCGSRTGRVGGHLVGWDECRVAYGRLGQWGRRWEEAETLHGKNARGRDNRRVMG